MSLRRRWPPRDFCVVCPDVAGRGRSGRLIAAASYAFPQYLADMTALIARLDVEQVSGSARRWAALSA